MWVIKRAEVIAGEWQDGVGGCSVVDMKVVGGRRWRWMEKRGGGIKVAMLMETCGRREEG